LRSESGWGRLAPKTKGYTDAPENNPDASDLLR
jgi:hypothetical protein